MGLQGNRLRTFTYFLKSAGVEKIIDTRLNPASQLAGFAKGQDLKFIADKIAGIIYEHNSDFTPTKDLLFRYRGKQITWQQYKQAYLDLLDVRKVAQKIDTFTLKNSCLLCSEHSPEKCDRRLLAEYLKRVRNEIKIIHLSC